MNQATCPKCKGRSWWKRWKDSKEEWFCMTCVPPPGSELLQIRHVPLTKREKRETLSD